MARLTRVWAIEPPPWDGLDFALLANNVNCIMCHTEVDSAQRVYNQDPSLYGTFDRTRVGSIESFQFRNNPDSEIAGTLYIGGSAESVTFPAPAAATWNVLVHGYAGLNDAEIWRVLHAELLELRTAVGKLLPDPAPPGHP